jgi:hypothetical protein
MWYNITPSFIPMDVNMYPMYYFRIKGLDPFISRRDRHANGINHPDVVPPIE